MATDYTSVIAPKEQNSAVSDRLFAKPDFNKDASNNAFDSLLSNASKPYTSAESSSRNNDYKSRDYANKTRETTKQNDRTSKNIDEPKSQDVKKNHERTESSQNDRISDNSTQNPTDRTERNTIDPSQENAQQSSQIGEDVKTKAQNSTAPEENLSLKDSQKQAEDIPANEQVGDAITEITANVLANEQLMSNVQYSANDTSETADLETVGEETSADNTTNGVKLEEIPKEVTEKVKQLVSQSQSQSQSQNAQPVETIIENIKMEAPDTDVKTPLQTTTPDGDDIEVKVENANSTKTNAETTPVKTAKESLANDTSRLTVNLENAVQEHPADEAAPVTPVDTRAKETANPVIQVTDEVAAQAKTDSKSFMENKDVSTKVKNKAVEQMTGVQNTDTTVTESKTQNNSENNNSLTQGNAQEQAVKLSVDNAAASVDNTTGTEAFINKLNSMNSVMSAKSVKPQNAMLNQESIMNQVNAKFNEIQQAGSNKVSIVLQPENLGKVSVEIMNSKDGIVAKMTTDNQQVKELFDKSVESLKSNLSSQGISVNNIKVECTQESTNNAMNFEREQFNQSNFSGSQNHQNHAESASQNAQTVYSDGYGYDESNEELINNAEITNTNTIIKHNGKVDYTV